MAEERLNRIKEVLVIQGKVKNGLLNKLVRVPIRLQVFVTINSTSPKDLKIIADVLEVDVRELLVPSRED